MGNGEPDWSIQTLFSGKEGEQRGSSPPKSAWTAGLRYRQIRDLQNSGPNLQVRRLRIERLGRIKGIDRPNWAIIFL
jgi:hypothetical protein